MPIVRRPGFALFEYGFRPFFLLAGLHALLAVPLWLWINLRGVIPVPALPPHVWHGHEMLYGFVVAAMAGFLLTAVPSWTGSRGFAGWPLILLVFLWAAGRAAFTAAGVLPLWLTGLCELGFLPALAALLAPPLLRAVNRNTPMLAVLAALWLLDAAFVVAMGSGDVLLAQQVLRLAIDIVLILVTIIGGRIVPAFTANALRRRGEPATAISRAWLDRLVIGAFGMMILAVMTRASLGHTGRPLTASRATVVAYILLATAVATRVFGPGITALDYRTTVVSAGVLWALAFALFVHIYTPVLIRPRVDGKPG